MAFNRDLSQFAAYLELDAAGNYIGITTGSKTNIGFGKANPTSKIDVVGDGNFTGVVTATSFHGSLNGNAGTATSLETARDFSISGDASSSTIAFNGTQNVGLAITLASTGVVAGSYGSSTQIPTFTVDAKGRLTAAGSASVGAALTVAGDSGTETINFLSENLTISGGTNLTSSAASNAVTINLDDNISLTSVNATGVITAAQFVTGASGAAIGINTNTISGPAQITIDPAGVGDNTGLVVIKGDLQIDGTTTTVNSTTVTVDDKNIQIADGAINDAAADGAGFTVTSGEGNKTFQFEASGDNFGSSENMNLASGKVYKINNVEVLSGTTLGSNVVNSSLTSVGTLTKLDVGNVNSTGIVTASGGFSGNLTGNASTASALQTARTIALSGDVVGQVSFDGSANVSIAATIQPNSVSLGDDTTGNYVATVADSGSSDILVSGSGSETAAVTLGLSTTGVAAGSYGSSNAIPTFTVDSRGRLTAAGSVNVATALTVTGDTGSEIINLGSESLKISGGTNLTSSAASDTVTINLDDNISLTSVVASGIITATGGFSGNFTGNVTGDVTGNLTGEVNAAAFDTNASGVVVTGVATATSGFSGNLTGNVTGNLTGEVNATAFDTNASGVVVTGITTSTGGFSGNLTGTATTATYAVQLQTARTIALSGDVVGQVSFDGSSNVSIAATIQPNSVSLGDDTTGNYVATVADSGSSDIVVNNSGTETAAVTLGLSTTGVAAGSYGSSTQIPTFTVDSRGRLTAAGTASVGTALTVAGDSGSENINLLTETLTISGGTNLTSSAASDTVTINLDPTISLTGVNATGVITAAQFVTGASGAAIGINTNTISGPATITLDPAGVGDNTGLVVIKGDLQIDGTTTTVNSTTVTVDDKNLILASGAINDAAADGGGITVESGNGNKTWNWVDSTDSWTSSEHIDLASGKVYKIGGTEVLSSSTLGSGVVNSSLTSVGTLGGLNVSGVATINQIDVNGISPDGINYGSNNYVPVANGSGGWSWQPVTSAGSGTLNGITVKDDNAVVGTAGSITELNFGVNIIANASGTISTISVSNNPSFDSLSVSGITTSTGGFSGNLTGTATTATYAVQLQTARTIALSGDVVGQVSFDGTSNVSIAATIQPNSVALGDDTTGNYVATVADSGSSDIVVNNSGTETAAVTLGLTTTGVVAGSYGSSTQIPTFTVDSRGRLTVAGSASVGAALTVTGDSGSETINFLNESLAISGGTNLTSSAASNAVTINLDDNISLTSVNATGVITATSGFSGNLTGNVTGNLNSSGLSTVTNININGYVSAGNTYGILNQVLTSVGAGVTWKSINDVLPQTRTTSTVTATNGQTAFTFTYNVNYLDVFVNGVKLSSSDFTATNGSNITLTEPAFDGDKVEFISYATVGGGTGTVNSLNDLSDVSLSSNVSGNLLSYNGSEWVNTSNLNVGIITCTSVTASGDISAANFNSTSDVNLKDNIRPIENASELVAKLEGVHFTWKESGAETCGVIAQQIEEHLPQLVHTGEDHKSVNYNGLVGVLLAAVKEQGAQIAALQAEVEELKK